MKPHAIPTAAALLPVLLLAAAAAPAAWPSPTSK